VDVLWTLCADVLRQTRILSTFSNFHMFIFALFTGRLTFKVLAGKPTCPAVFLQSFSSHIESSGLHVPF
jgi:hypothetical protein